MTEPLEAWITAYDQQGWHRTGSRADAASARWLAGVARELGAAAEYRAWPLARVVHRASALATPAGRLPGVVLFDADLPTRRVSGKLGNLGSPAAIGVCDLAQGGAESRLQDARRAGPHQGIVCLTGSASGALGLLNAPEAQRPFGPPVLQLAGRHRARVAGALAAQAVCALEVDAVRRAARAVNVLASPATETSTTVPDGTSAPGVVVLTPRSGWWQCAAERGGGIACWLAALAAARHLDRPGAVRFLATSGHELGHLGLRAALEGETPSPGATWLHLGANLGARGGTLSCWASDPELLGVIGRAFTDAGSKAPAALSGPMGEATNLHALGYRCVSLVGTNAQFHTPEDRAATNVDFSSLRAISRAVNLLLARLVRLPHVTA